MITLTEADHAVVSSTARILRSRYRQFVEYEDVQQELYVYLLRKYDKVQSWREELGEQHAERTISRALRNAGEIYCRNEKAQQSGYSPDDEFFYSIQMVEDMLELYFDPEWMAPPALEPTATSGGKPPQEGWNLQAMVADVGKAYESMPAHDQALLARVFGDPMHSKDEMAVLALEWEISLQAADKRIRRVVGRVRSKLGGPRPHMEDE